MAGHEIPRSLDGTHAVTLSTVDLTARLGEGLAVKVGRGARAAAGRPFRDDPLSDAGI
ncbi:MAG: hypothetical protein ACOYOB_12920 [Myxococcota bacterium]